MANWKRISLLKYLLLGMSAAVLVAAPARAQTLELSCNLTPSEQQDMVTLGDPSSNDEVIHLSIDKHAWNDPSKRKITEWMTPTDEFSHKTIYKAKFAGNTAAWTIGDIKDGPQAHESVNFSTNVLTTVDPEGHATQWNCSSS